jgi:hypothetical protein
MKTESEKQVWIHAGEFQRYTKGMKTEQVGSMMLTLMRLAARDVPDLDKEFPFISLSDPCANAEGTNQ